MGNLLSPTHLLIILLIILILFGRGKVSEFMGDFAKGIKSFKKGLSDEDEQKPQAPEARRSLNESGSQAEAGQSRERQAEEDKTGR